MSPCQVALHADRQPLLLLFSLSSNASDSHKHFTINLVHSYRKVPILRRGSHHLVPIYPSTIIEKSKTKFSDVNATTPFKISRANLRATQKVSPNLIFHSTGALIFKAAICECALKRIGRNYIGKGAEQT